MTKKEFFDWIKENEKKYPALEQIMETEIDGIKFIELPVKYGIYKGLYFCEQNNSIASKLRKDGYAVGITADYGITQSYILECVKRLARKKK